MTLKERGGEALDAEQRTSKRMVESIKLHETRWGSHSLFGPRRISVRPQDVRCLDFQVSNCGCVNSSQQIIHVTVQITKGAIIL